jgi:hypothetical protein
MFPDTSNKKKDKKKKNGRTGKSNNIRKRVPKRKTMKLK